MCKGNGNGSNIITTLLLLSLVGGMNNDKGCECKPYSDNDENHNHNNGHKPCNCHKQHKGCKNEEEAVVIIR